MTITINGYSGTVTAGGVDGDKITGGLTVAGGDGTKPLALSVVKNGESEGMPFAIRLASDVSNNIATKATIEPYNYTMYSSITETVDGNYTNSNGYGNSGGGFKFKFDSKKSISKVKAYGYYNERNDCVQSVSVLDSKMNLITTIDKDLTTTGQYIELPVSISDDTIYVVLGKNQTHIGRFSEIEIFEGDPLPTTSKVTVSAEGENSADWAFAKTTDGFAGYGVPLVINEALTDKNMIVYAKCKSTTSDVIGNDTTTKIKIVAE